MKKLKLQKAEEEWTKKLTKDEFKILREKGTEPPFSGKFVDSKKHGVYLCAGCGQELFSSKTKFDSGSGWPSFWQPIRDDSIDKKIDNSMGMNRTEVLCNRCGGHLGHVFDDGPPPTGLRFCINSIALRFKDE